MKPPFFEVHIMVQLHKKFTDSQVKEFISRYLRKEIKRNYIQDILGIKRRRFCELVKKYQENPDTFSIQYTRKGQTPRYRKQYSKGAINRKELSMTAKS